MTVAFTGYRPSKMPFAEDGKDELYVRFRKREMQVIQRLVERGCTHFISGAAQGFDTWVAEDIILLKKENSELSLECAVPFPDQAKSWSREEQKRRKKILEKSDKVEIVCPSYSSGCFHERNRYMVDHADVVVCAFDGQPGGTAYTVDYALKKNKIVIQINPMTNTVRILSDRKFE